MILSVEPETMSRAERCVNTPRPLTRSLESTKEGCAVKATRICSVEGCGRQARSGAAEFCQPHYMSNWRHGDPLAAEHPPAGPCALSGCDRQSSSRGLCKTHYERWRQTGSAGPTAIRAHKLGPGTRLLPFWDRVQVIEDADSCWVWKAGLPKSGRATMRFEGRNQYVYRIAWQLANGPIPDGMHICHHCDNPPCCRPSHLFVGTHRDNMLDGRRKGRIPLPANSPRGDTHHDATVPNEQVAEARRLYATGAFSQRELAARYGVSQSVIGGWVRGTIRRDAGGPITKRGSRSRENR